VSARREPPTALIAGGGIGGLTAALALDARGVRCRVFKATREIRPLGVGINLLPHAVRVLTRLGLDERVGAQAVETAALAYHTRLGQRIWSEPRGRGAGYDHPQFSVHRGVLQLALRDVVLLRLGRDAIVTDRAVASFAEDGDGVTVQLARREDGTVVDHARGDLLVGADGIHSAVRRQLDPQGGGVRYGGRLLWRAVTRAEPFLGGRTMIMAGHQDQKFVCYPSTPADGDGLVDVNWIAELARPGDAPPPQDWSRQADRGDFREAFAGWRFDWLDVPALIDGAAAVYEYPLADRDPLERWSTARVTLLGDAAHAMYPIGSNGASQAILDAEALGAALAWTLRGHRAGHLASSADAIAEALAAYEAERRPATTAIVLANRGNGPEQVMQLAEERAPDGFDDVHDVIPREELEAIAAAYKQLAGFAPEQVNRTGV
jgi:2-polyprenyl-6-methoxyphenol hydroxylase-like FAD-dependent oxidoreductase